MSSDVRTSVWRCRISDPFLLLILLALTRSHKEGGSESQSITLDELCASSRLEKSVVTRGLKTLFKKGYLGYLSKERFGSRHYRVCFSKLEMEASL